MVFKEDLSLPHLDRSDRATAIACPSRARRLPPGPWPAQGICSDDDHARCAHTHADANTDAETGTYPSGDADAVAKANAYTDVGVDAEDNADDPPPNVATTNRCRMDIKPARTRKMTTWKTKTTTTTMPCRRRR